MPDRISLGYVVVTYNQASHQPGLPTGADLTDMETAVRQREWEQAETAKAGRAEAHVIAEVFELSEGEVIQATAERAEQARAAAHGRALREAAG